MFNLIFATLALPGKAEQDALLLIESIRTFGGRLANNPIVVLVPASLGPLSKTTQGKFARLEVDLHSFQAEPALLKFPLAVKTEAAAYLEQLAQGQTERLAFMDRDTLVLQEPGECLLSAGHSLGYRPVHHQLIGSTWDEPVDDFWQLIYDFCEVPDGNIFPMMTHAGERIRPCFNAGMFIVRPERGLLAQWREHFLKYYRHPRLQTFYEKNPLYSIFIHQAIFSGVLLHNLEPHEMYELSPKINYPLHLHAEIPAAQQPAAIDELVTARYENIFDAPGWQHLPLSAALKTWLAAQPRVKASLQGSAQRSHSGATTKGR